MSETKLILSNNFNISIHGNYIFIKKNNTFILKSFMSLIIRHQLFYISRQFIRQILNGFSQLNIRNVQSEFSPRWKCKQFFVTRIFFNFSTTTKIYNKSEKKNRLQQISLPFHPPNLFSSFSLFLSFFFFFFFFLYRHDYWVRHKRRKQRKNPKEKEERKRKKRKQEGKEAKKKNMKIEQIKVIRKGK